MRHTFPVFMQKMTSSSISELKTKKEDMPASWAHETGGQGGGPRG